MQTQAARPLERERALAAYARGESPASALRVVTPSRALLGLTLLSLVLCAAVLSFVGTVDVTGRGRGLMRAAGGSQMVRAAVAGRVVEVHRRSGDWVRVGEPLVKLDSVDVRATLVEVESSIALLDTRIERLLGPDAVAHARHLALLSERARALQRQIASLDASNASFNRVRASYASLEQSGWVSQLERSRASEDARRGSREQLRLESELTDLRLTVHELERARSDELARLEAERAEAHQKRAAVQLKLRQTTVEAPQAGRVEAMLVRSGDELGIGAAISQVVPAGVPTEIVSYVPERERAFLRAGAAVRVEPDQLPVGEFGALRGRVTRIAATLATDLDVRETLGERVGLDGPLYRVDVKLDDKRVPARVLPRLRAGMLVNVRYALRERRLIALLFAPVRRWLE